MVLQIMAFLRRKNSRNDILAITNRNGALSDK